MSRHRIIETQFQAYSRPQVQTAAALLEGLAATGALRASRAECHALAESMIMIATYWLSYQFVLHPRRRPDSGYAYMASSVRSRWRTPIWRPMHARYSSTFRNNTWILKEQSMPAKQPKWKSFPGSDEDFDYPGPALEKHWPRLHQGDCEPFPDAAYVKKLFETYPELKTKVPAAEVAEVLQEAWRAYHRGDFQKAVELGLALGRLGSNVANKAANIYATYLEEDKERKLALFLDSVHRGEALQQSAPGLANAWYFHAQALGRYSQGISVSKALAEGHGGKIKDSLEKALQIEPKHADAHIALGALSCQCRQQDRGARGPAHLRGEQGGGALRISRPR